MERIAFPIALRLAADGGCTAMFDLLAVHLNRLVGYDLLTILVPHGTGEYLLRVYSTDESAYPLEKADPVRNTPWFEQLFANGEPVIATNPHEIAVWLPDYNGFSGTAYGSFINYPVVAAGQTIGLINVVSGPNVYGETAVRSMAGGMPLAAMSIATYARANADELIAD
jgi:transcriptional regulator with GAF, ATPase, and Fis domain